MAVVTIVDYGCGNIYSVMRAFEHCGAQPELSSDARAVSNAERLVLPGVGAFGSAVRTLRDHALVEPVLRFVRTGRPLLGICLGMQMLASASEEFGEHQGLGLVPGRVVPIPRFTVDGKAQKIPHIGWTELHEPVSGRWSGTLFDGLAAHTAVYLVHSFHVEPEAAAHRLADCYYGGHRITAAVQSGNCIGCQFHPERSGEAGLRVLASFLRL